MMDIRKIIMILVVAVLFSVLVFAVIEAVYPEPRYEDFCSSQQPRPSSFPVDTSSCVEVIVPAQDVQLCVNDKGYVDYNYDSKGCATDFFCNTCNRDLQLAQDKHNYYVFYISAFFALIAIFIGLYLPAHKNTLNEWIGTGFMLGGAFALFFGTATTYTSLGRIIRPIIIFLELLLVIFVAYKKIGNLRKDNES
jgi:hypothetical protein